MREWKIKGILNSKRYQIRKRWVINGIDSIKIWRNKDRLLNSKKRRLIFHITLELLYEFIEIVAILCNLHRLIIFDRIPSGLVLILGMISQFRSKLHYKLKLFSSSTF